MGEQGCLCDALAASDEADQDAGKTAGKNEPRGAERFTWSAGAGPRPQVDDGRATHLEAMAALGIGRLLDAHSHWFPEEVERKIWRYFDEHYWNVAYREPQEERREWMRRNGAERFTVLTYAHRAGMAEWLNEWVARFAQDVPEAIPCGTFFPEPGAGREVRRCIEQYGFRGFKLHIQVSGFDPNDGLLDEAFEQVAHAGLPVVIHIGNAPDSGPYTSPEVLRRLLTRHDRLKVVVAHMGAMEFDDYLSIAEDYDSVYLDTTMVFVGFSACGQFPQASLNRLQKLAGRVLFGSDFPTIPYAYSHAVEGILSLPFSADEKKGILGENAAALFGA